MSAESYYPSYIWAGFLLAYPPWILLTNANEKCGQFYGFFLVVLTIFCVVKHVPIKVEQETNGPKLTKKQRTTLLKIDLLLLLACLILQHFIAFEYSRHYSEYYSDDPYYWPMMYFMFALGLCSIILTCFMAGHSISLFHPSDFLDSYEIIISFIYFLIVADLGKNITERMYFVFYPQIIKGIFSVFLDSSGFVDTCDESEMVIIRTWTGRKYRGHPSPSSWPILFIFEFKHLEECVEGKLWEKSKRHFFLGVQIMWMKRCRRNPEVFGLA